MGKGSKKTKKEKMIVKSMVEHYFPNQALYEELYNRVDNHAFFAKWDGNKLVERDTVENNDEKKVYPIFDEGLEKGIIKLPSGIEKYENEGGLVRELIGHIHKYCDISDFYEQISAYYILLSWLSDRLNTVPYLRVLGDTGTGKSRFLKVVGGLLYKPITVAGAVTPAPIYRVIDLWHGTLIIDEADFSKDSDLRSELIKILNCGFEREKAIMRCNKDDPNKLQYFDAYGAKLLATRQTFQDKALESRCFTEVMKETGRNDIPHTLTLKFDEEQEKLRNKLLLFRFKWWDKVNLEDVSKANLGNIEPRLKQTAAPFAAVFGCMSEDFFLDFKRFLKDYNRQIIEERAMSFDGAIVNSLIELVESGENEITSHQIADYMSNTMGMHDAKGRPYNPGTIGRHLKQLKIETHIQRGQDKKVKRVLKAGPSLIMLLAKRYLVDFEERKDDLKVNVDDIFGKNAQKSLTDDGVVDDIDNGNEGENGGETVTKNGRTVTSSSVTSVTKNTANAEKMGKNGEICNSVTDVTVVTGTCKKINKGSSNTQKTESRGHPRKSVTSVTPLQNEDEIALVITEHKPVEGVCSYCNEKVMTFGTNQGRRICAGCYNERRFKKPKQ